MPFNIMRNDIARVHADALVNAANEHLLEGGGVCGALFAGAGRAKMRQACEAIGGCPTGSAVSTPGFGLHCQWVIHAVGPVWHGGGRGEERLLRSCYQAIFAEVVRLGARSVAFPLISAGIYGYPAREALAIAREEAAAFLALHDGVDVTLVTFDRKVVAAGTDLLGQIREYIDDVYVEESPFVRSRDSERWFFDGASAEACAPAAPADLEDLLGQLDASFSDTLMALIDERGLTDAQVYKRANLSRQLFSKIRSNAAYHPTKQTAVALCLALELDLAATQDLLARAGLTLSHSSRFDVIVEFFIKRRIYDVMRVNEALFAFDQQLLGSV